MFLFSFFFIRVGGGPHWQPLPVPLVGGGGGVGGVGGGGGGGGCPSKVKGRRVIAPHRERKNAVKVFFFFLEGNVFDPPFFFGFEKIFERDLLFFFRLHPRAFFLSPPPPPFWLVLLLFACSFHFFFFLDSFFFFGGWPTKECVEHTSSRCPEPADLCEMIR